MNDLKRWAVTAVRGSEARSVGLPAEKRESPRISVVKTDITMLGVDAVVNAANSRMRGGGGVDGAIHAAGGREVMEDCIRRFPDGLGIGDAGWTTAGRMQAQWVIHVVGPDRQRGQTDRALLESCYTRALEVADELAVRSIAFPLIGAGAFGWPLDTAAEAAVSAIRSASTHVTEVTLVAFGAEALEALNVAVSRDGGQ